MGACIRVWPCGIEGHCGVELSSLVKCALARALTWAGPGPGRARAGPGPGPGQGRARAGPGQGRARAGPGPGQGRARAGPGRAMGQGPVFCRLGFLLWVCAACRRLRLRPSPLPCWPPARGRLPASRGLAPGLRFSGLALPLAHFDRAGREGHCDGRCFSTSYSCPARPLIMI